jgi:hypothetical protein
MIKAFERENPPIKVKVVVDPSGANGLALRVPGRIRRTSFEW